MYRYKNHIANCKKRREREAARSRQLAMIKQGVTTSRRMGQGGLKRRAGEGEMKSKAREEGLRGRVKEAQKRISQMALNWKESLDIRKPICQKCGRSEYVQVCDI